MCQDYTQMFHTVCGIGARFAMVCAGIGQLGVNIPAQSTYYHSNMKYWNISTIMHVLCNTLLILLGEASNLSCPPPNSFWVYLHSLWLQAFLGAKAPPPSGHVCLTE